MTSATGIRSLLQDLESMSSKVSVQSSEDRVVAEGESVTATLEIENRREGELTLEYDNGTGIGVEVYMIPSDIRTIHIYSEEDTARLVVNNHDYGF